MQEEQIRRAATELALRIAGKYIDEETHGGPEGAADMFLDFYTRIYARLAQKNASSYFRRSAGSVSDLGKVPPVSL